MKLAFGSASQMSWTLLQIFLAKVFIKRKAVEVSVNTFAIRRHECEKLRFNLVLRLNNIDMLWEYELQKRLHLFLCLAKREQNFWLNVNLHFKRLFDSLSKRLLCKPADKEVLNQ